MALGDSRHGALIYYLLELSLRSAIPVVWARCLEWPPALVGAPTCAPCSKQAFRLLCPALKDSLLRRCPSQALSAAQEACWHSTERLADTTDLVGKAPGPLPWARVRSPSSTSLRTMTRLLCAPGDAQQPRVCSPLRLPTDDAAGACGAAGPRHTYGRRQRALGYWPSNGGYDLRGGSRQVVYSTAADRIAFSLKLPCVGRCTCVSHHCSACHYNILASLDLAEASNKEFTTRGWPNSQRGVYWAVHPCTGLS